MKGLHLIFLALSVLPLAISLKCKECANVPGLSVPRCDSDKVPERQCEPMFDSCMTIKGTWDYPLLFPKTDIIMMNCSSSYFCKGKIPDVPSACDIFNFTGLATSCSYKCCHGDLCDPYAPVKPTVDKPSNDKDSCASDLLPVSQCDPGIDYCPTLLKASVSLPGKTKKRKVIMRDCSDSLVCSGRSKEDLEICGMFNIPGFEKPCPFKCCEGRRCDKPAPSLAPPTTHPKVTYATEAPWTVFPPLSGLQCYECASYPYSSEVSCDNPYLPIVQCPFGMDRCMTLKSTMSIAGNRVEVTMRNCSSSLFCNGNKRNDGLCDMLNITGVVKGCSYKCCEGDLCNPYVTPSPPIPSTNMSVTPTNETSPSSPIRCHYCSSYPQSPGPECNGANLPIATCDPKADRCMTVKARVFGYDVTLRNCSSSSVCSGQSPVGEVCDLLNVSGLVTNCSHKCCEGDLCDPWTDPVNDTKPVVSRQCYECSSIPSIGTSPCSAPNLPVTNCAFGLDRCMTVKGTLEFFGKKTDIMTRNCANDMLCRGELADNDVCKLFNVTGDATSCTLKCCDGDLCDPFTEQPSASPHTMIPTDEPYNSTISVTAAPSSSRQCYRCTDYPGFDGVRCDESQLPVSYCMAEWNRCFALKANVGNGETEMTITSRFCANNLTCGGDNPVGDRFCNSLNATGHLTSCRYKCCDEDFCDPFITEPSPSPPTNLSTKEPVTSSTSQEKSSHRCYKCSDTWGSLYGNCSGPNVPVIECRPGMDRCVTVKLSTLGSSSDLMAKDCSNSYFCNLEPLRSDLCDSLNRTGLGTSCESKCCEGDLCDPFIGQPSLPPTKSVTTEEAFNITNMTGSVTAQPFGPSKIQCYECADFPLNEGSRCDSLHLPSTACAAEYDRCLTLKVRMAFGDTRTFVNFRHCADTSICSGQSGKADSICAQLNSTGSATSCSYKCCDEDLCDPFIEEPSPSPSTKVPTDQPVNETSISTNRCYRCSDHPRSIHANCSSPSLPIVECSSGMDRCMTLKTRIVDIDLDMEVMARDCSNSLFCNMDEMTSGVCSSLGSMERCSHKCCEGDLCDPFVDEPSPSSQSTQPPFNWTTLPTDSSIACYECSNLPGQSDINCDSTHVPITKCALGLDRCMTLKGTLGMPDFGGNEMDITIKKCYSSMVCNGSNPMFDLCTSFNVTGSAKSCSFKCCKGDLCDPSIEEPSQPPTMNLSTDQGVDLQTNVTGRPAGPSKIQCQECADFPLYLGSRCDSSNVPIISCSPQYDQCFMLKASMAFGDTSTIIINRGCADTSFCNGENAIPSECRSVPSPFFLSTNMAVVTSHEATREGYYMTVRRYEISLQETICAQLNSTGLATSCSYKCCDKDGCDPFIEEPSPSPSTNVPTDQPVNVTSISTNRCYRCSDHPRSIHANCSSPSLPIVECSSGMDRCMTLKTRIVDIDLDMEVMARDCSNSLFCNMDNMTSAVCGSLGSTKLCSHKCCEGDLCDPFIDEPSPSPTTNKSTESPFSWTMPPTDSSIQCYECSDLPRLSGPGCDSPYVPFKKCTLGLDRCMTMKATLNMPGTERDITVRTCYSSLGCSGQQTNVDLCRSLNVSGLATSCSFKCCEGDFCDPFRATNVPTNQPVAMTTPPSKSPIRCYKCADFPGSDETSCKSNTVPVQECFTGMDRCVAVKATTEILGTKQEFAYRDCYNSNLCQTSDPCASFNSTGIATSCSFKCCHGDLCDPFDPKNLQDETP